MLILIKSVTLKWYCVLVFGLEIWSSFSRNTLPCYDLSFYVQSTIISDKPAYPINNFDLYLVFVSMSIKSEQTHSQSLLNIIWQKDFKLRGKNQILSSSYFWNPLSDIDRWSREEVAHTFFLSWPNLYVKVNHPMKNIV